MSFESGFNCEVCGKQFDAACKLETHQRSHTGERPFPCDQCEKTFTVFSNLKRHKKTVHEKQRPFACEICGKAFNQTSNLKRHMKVHPEAANLNVGDDSHSVSSGHVDEDMSQPDFNSHSTAEISWHDTSNAQSVYHPAPHHFATTPQFSMVNSPAMSAYPNQYAPAFQLGGSERAFSSMAPLPSHPIHALAVAMQDDGNGMQDFQVNQEVPRVGGSFISLVEALEEPDDNDRALQSGGGFITQSQEEPMRVARSQIDLANAAMPDDVLEITDTPVFHNPKNYGQQVGVDMPLYQVNADEAMFGISGDQATPQERLIDLPAMRGSAYSAGSSNKGISFFANTPVKLSVSSSAKNRLSTTMDVGSFRISERESSAEAVRIGSGSYMDALTRSVSDAPFFPQ